MTDSKVRRSGRISREIPILLIGSDAEGTVFSEKTKTVVLSRYGAGIVSANKLVAEQELTLRSLESNRETDIRIVGEIGSQEHLHTYGVTFTDPTLDFWQIQFPPAASSEREALTISLECSGCGAGTELQQGDFEADVCLIHGGIVRYCDECAMSTMWKRSQEAFPMHAKAAAKQKKQPLEAAVAVLERPVAKPTDAAPPANDPDANRRERVRAKVNFFACVRTNGFGDDIVHCIDMSRGGLSFKTIHSYEEGSTVHIAVPFSPESREAPAIFVPAKIVYLKELPAGKIFRCGVAYLPMTESYSKP